MALFGRPRNRSLFDQMVPERPGYATPGYGEGVPMERPMEQPMQSGFWEGGDKFRARDGIAGLLAVLGDAFTHQGGGGQGGAVQNLSGGRLKALDMARRDAQRQAAQQAMEQQLMASGVDPAKARLVAMGGAKYGDVVDKPTDFMRNAEWAGNLQGPEGARTIQGMDTYAPTLTNTPSGTQFVPRPRPMGVGQLPPGFDPNRYEVVPGPQESSQNGAFTQEMYQGLVSSLGQQQADEWMRRNNIHFGGR